MIAAAGASAALGLWLIASAFVWTHSSVHHSVAWVCGATAVLFGLTGLEQRWVRHANAAVGLLLLAAIVNVHPEHPATFWNHLLCGVGLIALTLLATARRVWFQ
jgi:hypothetical protein